MICVEDLHYDYPPVLPDGGWRTVLDGVSFEVPEGGCMAITGPNNAGKTTLCLAVSGLLPRLSVGRIRGQITVDGRDVQAEPLGTLADTIGLVMEDPAGQLFTPTVAEEIAWGLENLRTPTDEIGARIEWALKAVGLAEVSREQAPQTLSGGQQKRLALAAALALRPQVLVLDQPAGGLTPQGRSDMIEVLAGLRRRESLTVLLSERDPKVITQLADELVIFEGGRVARRGVPADLYSSLDEGAYPSIERPPASIFASIIRQAGEINRPCLTVEDALAEARRYTITDVPVEPGKEEFTAKGPAAVEVEGVRFAFEPGVPVLRGLDLTIRAGEFVALMGDNGAGKTTLARHLIGLLQPDAGHVRVKDKDTTEHTVGALSREVGLAFQRPEQQMFSATVREEIAFGPRNLGVKGEALDAVIEDALGSFALRPLASHPPAVLSFSDRRLVALASIAAMRTPILILDESTIGLDTRTQARVMGWLTEHHRQGGTVVLITHDVELAARHAERVLVMVEGQIAADGPPRDVFTRSDVLARAGLESPFAVKFAKALGHPALVADLTPEGAAQAWLEARA